MKIKKNYTRHPFNANWTPLLFRWKLASTVDCIFVSEKVISLVLVAVFIRTK